MKNFTKYIIMVFMTVIFGKICFACDPPTAVIQSYTSSPQCFNGLSFTFNGSQSEAYGGRYIINYDWIVLNEWWQVVDEQDNDNPYYTFTPEQTGNFYVYLVVTDNEYYESENEEYVMVSWIQTYGITSELEAAPVGHDIKFHVLLTPTVEPVGLVSWSGGGVPATQQGGGSFVTHWDTIGTKTVTVSGCGGPWQKQVTIVDVDLDIAGCSEADEETVGAFIALNDNDDNENGVPDSIEDHLGVWDLDLKQISLSILPSMNSGQVKLEEFSGCGNIQIWGEPEKINRIIPDASFNYYKIWDLSSQSIPSHLYVEGIYPSGNLTDVGLTLSYIKDSTEIHSDRVNSTVIDVDYAENTSQKYGYDGYTNLFGPYKSVKVSDTDTFYALIEDDSLVSSVYFVSSDTSKATVSPLQPSSSPQTVTITGVAEGFSQIISQLNSSGPYGTRAATLVAKPYNEDTYNVAVRVINETGGWQSTDPFNATASDLEDYLNYTIYNQSVVKWEVSKAVAATVNFDLDESGDLDVSVSGWTDEQEYIIEHCDLVGFDRVVFIVNNPDMNWCGCSKNGEKYAFVFPNISDYETNTTAHELGHAAFKLDDLVGAALIDIDNLMHPTEPCPVRLRINQWEQTHD